MTAPDRRLLLVFLLLALALLFRVSLESTHFLSPDSRYYLHIAANLASGNGFVMTDVTTHSKLVPVTIWPAGYPMLIAATAVVTGLSVFWASKLLNVLLLGGCLLLLRVVNKEKAWLLSLVFGSYTLIEVFSYTWSEVPFLFFLLLFSVALHKCAFQEGQGICWLWLFLAACGLFLTRYVGLFSVGLLGGASGFFLLKKETRRAAGFFGLAILTGLLVLMYFYRNYQINGHLTGSSRTFEHHETLGHFLWILVRGLFNQLLLFRQSYFKGPTDYLFWFLAAVQFGWLGWLFLRFGPDWRKVSQFKQAGFSHSFLLVAAAYFVLIVLLRFFVPFDSFDFRILSPVALLVYLAVMQQIVAPENRPETTRAEKQVALLLLAVLLVNVLKPSFLTTLLSYF